MNNFIEINKVKIGLDYEPYCIAEVGINHNGDFERACEMIDCAKEAGADAVKFQTFKSQELCGDKNQMFTYKSQGKDVTESMLDMFERYEFDRNIWSKLKEYADKQNITFFSTPQNFTDLQLLLELPVPAIKIGSDDFVNLPLISKYSSTGLPIILSCGMSDIGEVYNALDTVGWYKGYPVALMLCTSQYPTPPKDVNINKLATLSKTFPNIILGFSDHTENELAACLAVSMGARIFEKHFTLDNNLPGPDHWFSVNPKDLEKWIKSIKQSYEMIGSPHVKPTEEEKEMRVIARRSIVAIKDIAKNEEFNESNVGMRRPGSGIPATMMDQIINLRSTRLINKGECIKIGDIKNSD